tara:strand:+ start:222 stop:575 length:354 start_codon:yes stop_codon:yes gene_type:complete
MDEVENKMDNNTITEGDYLKDMDEMKKFYDCFTESHKIDGCSDCIMDDEPDDDDSNDNEIAIPVEPFFWRGNEYAIGDPVISGGVMSRVLGARPLFNIVPPHDGMGHVTNVGEVIIY